MYEYDYMRRINEYLHSEFPIREWAEYAAMWCRTMSTNVGERYDVVAVPRDGYVNYRVYLMTEADHD